VILHVQFWPKHLLFKYFFVRTQIDGQICWGKIISKVLFIVCFKIWNQIAM